MKTKNIFLLLSCCYYFSCTTIDSKPINTAQVSRSEENRIKKVDTQVIQNGNLKKIEIIDDKFVFQILETDLTIDTLKLSYNLIKKRILSNLHNNSLKDTIFVYSNNVDSFEFHGTQSNIFLKIASIYSPKITLLNSIRIGVAANIFQKKFGLKNIPDTLEVKDLENSSVFQFVFKDKHLDKIFYRALYID